METEREEAEQAAKNKNITHEIVEAVLELQIEESLI